MLIIHTKFRKVQNQTWFIKYERIKKKSEIFIALKYIEN